MTTSIANKPDVAADPPEETREVRDKWTLRVRGGNPTDQDERKRPTDPVGLSRSILHVLQQNSDGYVNVQSVGPTALNVVMAAYRITKNVVNQRTDGVKLVCSQSEYTAMIDNKPAKGVCTRMFPIPTKYAL